MCDSRIFLDAPLHSLALVDILYAYGTKIMPLAFLEPILDLLGKNFTCLCECVISRFFIDNTLNSLTQVDTKIMYQALINPILDQNSS